MLDLRTEDIAVLLTDRVKAQVRYTLWDQIKGTADVQLQRHLCTRLGDQIRNKLGHPIKMYVIAQVKDW